MSRDNAALKGNGAAAASGGLSTGTKPERDWCVNCGRTLIADEVETVKRVGREHFGNTGSGYGDQQLATFLEMADLFCGDCFVNADRGALLSRYQRYGGKAKAAVAVIPASRWIGAGGEVADNARRHGRGGTSTADVAGESRHDTTPQVRGS